MSVGPKKVSERFLGACRSETKRDKNEPLVYLRHHVQVIRDSQSTWATLGV